jgi:heptosyltransferase-3
MRPTAPAVRSPISNSRGRSGLQPDPTVRKVLIYRLGSLSDTVVALPCFHLIARMFPRAERVLLTNFPVHSKVPASAAVLGDSDLVHRYMRYTVGTRRVDELLGLAWKIRRFRAELLVYLMPPRPMKNIHRDQLFFRLAGVRRIVGLPGEKEFKHRFDAATGLYESEAFRLARTMAPLGDAHAEDMANWDPRLTAAERNTAMYALTRVHGRRLIACAPGTRMQANDWERENWRALLGRLSAKYPAHVLVMAGGKEDAATCDYVAEAWAGDKLNLAGILSPRESVAVFAHADIFMGPDSGPKHLAACMGVPCVCVFSARDLPGVWFPPGDRNQIIYHQPDCSGCGLETCTVMEKKCIRSVSVDEVEQAVDRVLRGV